MQAVLKAGLDLLFIRPGQGQAGLHGRLQQVRRLVGVNIADQRFLRLHALGKDVLCLTGDHAGDTGVAHDDFQRPDAPGIRHLHRRAGHQLRRGVQQPVPGQDGQVLTEDLMVRRLAPAQVIVVHGRQVIMDEAVGVDHLQGAGKGQRQLRLAAGHFAGRQQHHRPQAFAARQQAVAHGLQQPVRNLPQAFQHGAQGALHQGAVFLIRSHACSPGTKSCSPPS